MIEMSVDKETVLGSDGKKQQQSDGGTLQLEANSAPRPKNGLQQRQQAQRLGKRRNTMSGGFKHPGFGKRRRRANSESDPVLPTNFLLGGNIFDPLNLNSLLDEEVSRVINAETPKSSPLPAKSRDPVEILIPRDITDPLNLNSTGADAGILVSPIKSGGRKRHRNRHHGGAGGSSVATIPNLELSLTERGKPSEGGAALPEGSEDIIEAPLPIELASVAESPNPYELNTTLNCRDMVVSPQLPGSSTHASQTHGSLDSGLTGSAHPPHSRQRKRRRTSSKSDSATCAGSGAGGGVKDVPGKKVGRDKVRKPRTGKQMHLQTFHTPGTGVGWSHKQVQPQHQRKQKFQYGNYSKYYGYRNPNWCEDPRVRVFRPEWFQGKSVLDLGCNTGHLTLSVAKNLRPARMVGLDIDGGLIHAARQNVRHYLSEVQTQEARRSTAAAPKVDGEGMQGPAQGENKMEDSGGDTGQKVGESVSMETDGEQGEDEAPAVGQPFPVSLRISRGPIAAPPLPSPAAGDFPTNVSFVKANYVLANDALLETQKPEYDVIMCLSVTKWVHLNWGDAGLQRFFHRVFRHLRPGGIFILEPQPWGSYARRKKLTDTILKNYHNIRLKPDQFSTYLTSEVGFTSYELIGTPKSASQGFQRPIYLFHKGPSNRK